MKVLSDERRGFDENVPIFANTSKSEKGLHRKTFENRYDNVTRKIRWATIHYYHLLLLHHFKKSGKRESSQRVRI